MAVFQFPPLREGRPTSAWEITQRREISIPAPARGATSGDMLGDLPEDFNSRPCERGDGAATSTATSPTKFQFPPLREGRQKGVPAKNRRCDFNSRPCERGDDRFAAVRRCGEFQFPPLREGRHGG